jgi:hypothetical protein
MARNRLRIEIRHEPFAGGKAFGDTGPYERLLGKVHFAIDPAEKELPGVCDLELAPRNGDGMVEFAATLDIVKPIDMGRGNRRLLYEFSNRGGRSAITGFNYGRGTSMANSEYAGDGFLMRQGYTVVWSGWQGDLIDQGSNVVAYLPYALQDGAHLRGKVRQEYIVNAPGVLSVSVGASGEGADNVQPYPVRDRAGATLTMRERERDPRTPVPATQWELARATLKDGAPVLTPSAVDLYVKGGFKPGWIYEFIYETEGSRVMGLGFLGVRDLISWLRFETEDAAGIRNPLAGFIDKVYGTGASLSGRVIRQYVYEGWNRDAQGRRLFDAVHTHTGSGRLFHNTRFAQVGRYPRQHEEHQYPAEYYPFNFTPVPDPFTGKVDYLWKRPQTDPLVIHTHTETDYWGRHVSLTHTDPRDASDLEPPQSVRMYHLAGVPHAARPLNEAGWIGQLPPSSITAAPYRRAALMMLDEWVTLGKEPPATRVPKAADGTLVTATAALAPYAALPGIRLPADASRLPRYDYGPEFETRGIMSTFPPDAAAGREYPVRVPMVDNDGNCIAGVRYPDLAVPLGTYTGWALRQEGLVEGALIGNAGSFIPFARTRAQREATGDPRPSIEERYPSHAAYVQAVVKACEALVEERLMLQEDAERYVAAARERNPLDPAVPLRPLLDS